MSYNISDSVMSHLKNLYAEVDVSSFGPSQQKKLYNYAKTGIIKGGGVPAQIARSMRYNNKMPYLVIRRNHIIGNFIKDVDVYSKILGALAMVRIQNEGHVSDPYISGGRGNRYSVKYSSPEQFLEHKPEEFYVYQNSIEQYFHYKSLDEMEVNLNDPVIINFKEN
jgi:hypothetical protein